ncbi:MAG: PRC-barrel domain-containing protein [Thermoplasmata archaeon]|jgi:sporulation protein YlmC with PRC-barrel domain
MRKFVTELKGKTVMTSEGLILGTISNFVVDTETGQVNHVLVNPAEGIESDKYEKDAQGRLAIPFKTMKSVKDVVVLEVKD